MNAVTTPAEQPQRIEDATIQPIPDTGRHGNYDVEAFFDPSGGPYGRIGWVGMAAYLIGIAVEVPFMSTTLYTGPAASAMNGTDLSWIVGLVVTVPLYYFLARRLVRGRGVATSRETGNRAAVRD